MKLIDRDRAIQRVTVRSGIKPLAVAPLVVVLPYDRGRRRRKLSRSSHRIGLIAPFTARRSNPKLVPLADPQTADEPFPDSRSATGSQRMSCAVPAIEVADNLDGPGGRGPDREVDSRTIPRTRSVTAQLLPQPEVPPPVERVDVLIGQQRHVVPDGTLHQHLQRHLATAAPVTSEVSRSSYPGGGKHPVPAWLFDRRQKPTLESSRPGVPFRLPSEVRPALARGIVGALSARLHGHPASSQTHEKRRQA